MATVASRFTGMLAWLTARCLGALLLLAAPAVAADETFGIRTGYLSVDTDKRTNPTNLALTLAYKIKNHAANLRLEAEINRSISAGKDAAGDDLEFESNGVFLVTKTNHSMFLKYRAGWVRTRIIGNGSTRRDDGLALGIGFGVVSGDARLLIEFNQIADEASSLTFGLEF